MSLLSILGVLSSAIFSGTSLLYTTLGEVIDERSGIVNLGLEGVLLVGASSGFAITVITGNPYAGVLVAMLAGGLMNLILGYLIISRGAKSTGQRASPYVFRLWPQRNDWQALCWYEDQ